MSYGIVICSTCKREVHQTFAGDARAEPAWNHCEDLSPLCEGADVAYPTSVDEIRGEWCGRDAGPGETSNPEVRARLLDALTERSGVRVIRPDERTRQELESYGWPGHFAPSRTIEPPPMPLPAQTVSEEGGPRHGRTAHSRLAAAMLAVGQRPMRLADDGREYGRAIVSHRGAQQVMASPHDLRIPKVKKKVNRPKRSRRLSREEAAEVARLHAEAKRRVKWVVKHWRPPEPLSATIRRSIELLEAEKAKRAGAAERQGPR